MPRRKKHKGKKITEEKSSQGISPWRRQIHEQKPFLIFVGLFAGFMVLFYTMTLSSFFLDYFFPWYLNLNAKVSGAIISLFHDGVITNGSRVYSPMFGVNIERGCDATGPIALFISAVLAFPAPMTRRLIGIFVGSAVLISVNFARIVSLFFIGIYFQNFFHIMHVDVWQALFILLSIVLWSIWAQWALRKEPNVA
ncbi:MAG: hypothetical protein B6244_04710 [Candidatus Cloacimonetes bacterium 4572_55]|nr:MAG: hypothetical protein B6244_04710 [Candidatus Cloacimonetes bacterium 4572_55]